MAKRREDRTSKGKTVRRIDFTEPLQIGNETDGAWPVDRLDVSDDLDSGDVVIRAFGAGDAVVITPTLEQAQEFLDALGGAIIAADRTRARLSDHQSAVCFMAATEADSATFNQETVHRTTSGRCRMCKYQGHQVGPVDEGG